MWRASGNMGSLFSGRFSTDNDVWWGLKDEPAWGLAGGWPGAGMLGLSSVLLGPVPSSHPAALCGCLLPPEHVPTHCQVCLPADNGLCPHLAQLRPAGSCRHAGDCGLLQVGPNSAQD